MTDNFISKIVLEIFNLDNISFELFYNGDNNNNTE